MKTVMKKIFSLMLVAVLLVSAVPFAASAEETVTLYVDGQPRQIPAGTYSFEDFQQFCPAGTVPDTVNQCHDADHPAHPAGMGGIVGSGSLTISAGQCIHLIYKAAPAPQLCATCGKAVHEGTCCATCKEQGHTADAHCKDCGKVDCECDKPTTYTVRFSFDGNDNFWYMDVIKGNTVKDPGFTYSTDWTYLRRVDDTDNRVFLGWSTDKDAAWGEGLSVVVEKPVTKDTTYYALFKNVAVTPPSSSNGNGITNKDNTNKVYLHVYLNGNAGTIALTKDITDSYMLDDDKISNGEIWNYLDNNYYTAKNSKGMLIDGLYVNTGTSGTFPQQYYPDNNQPELDNIEELRSQGHVHIAVMLKNAVAKSSYSNSNTADSSNPKTGDMILAPVAVLGLSASALAVLFFLNKKRAY